MCLFSNPSVETNAAHFGRVVLDLVVSTKFLREPFLVGRFGQESFQLWAVSTSLNINAKLHYFL